MALLSDGEIEQRLGGIQWRREGDQIVREWKLSDFAEAMAFVNRVAEAAEAANHHPDIEIRWNRVKLRWWTHVARAITERDVEMAARTNELAQPDGQ